MWENLKLKFAAPNRQNILQLKSNLQNLRKGSDDIETYLDKVKIARDALETVGVFIDDEDIVVTVLRGLQAEFVAIKTVIRAQFVSCSLGELKTLLKAAEVDIENENQCSIPLTAMLAKNSSQVSSSLGIGSSPATTSLNAHTSTMSSSVAAPTLSTNQPQVQSMIHSSPSSSNILAPQGYAIQAVAVPSVAPVVPPGFTPQAVTSVLSIPTQHFYVPIPALPYGFPSIINPYVLNDNSYGMTGFFAGRGQARFNNNGGNNRFNNGGGFRLPYGGQVGNQVGNATNVGFGFNNTGFNTNEVAIIQGTLQQAILSPVSFAIELVMELEPVDHFQPFSKILVLMVVVLVVSFVARRITQLIGVTTSLDFQINSSKTMSLKLQPCLQPQPMLFNFGLPTLEPLIT
ncbi:uncharacterized protein LOC133713376 [Rosa rugosa]|uniref:uncharacterized protein LOC133713376 n=1 Tax=Rosa rugosa TaxID=74645 RepID=UPI002B412143|nr:uncharacterized protein LOC133713376 [Rosa rugosa]